MALDNLGRMAETTYRVAVVGGDGIGPEVIAQGLRVIEATGIRLNTTDYDLGGARYLRDGTILPDSVLDEWRDFDGIYLGAVGTPEVAPGVIERGLLLKMRFELDLYVNQRPFQTDTHDFVVIRENTEGSYAGEGGLLRKGTPHEIATQGSVNTRMGVELNTPFLTNATVLEGVVRGCNEKAKDLIYETRLEFDELNTEAQVVLGKLIEYLKNTDGVTHD